ncbi:CaiB/BaiF CoA transferase family protein [Sabulicella glaciei]|uniref:CoA transferase n=1 Tax=Sabulicella glaciei TaxID=2984948 RepID=A0ABT3NTV0_9PROT|nr:CoA transferase [Roseococcus sp. MDT2-1-1]MCW8085578.1 CoA transferase [Roseococcus sp. MDT2-1-1]
MSAPLAGVRIADFTWIGAGAYTTRMLADLGAEVIKIESATRFDTLRDARPFKDGIPGLNRSGYFADRNCGKRSVTLDLKHPQGLDLAKRIIAASDIVANNFAPGVMDRLGLGHDVVRALRPDAIYLAMSMKGATGPERDSRGYGLTIGALTGVQHFTSLPGRLPAGTGTNYPDHIPNPSHAAFAVLAALRHRRRTGEGQAIDIAQTEPTIALLSPLLLDHAVNGGGPLPRGNSHPDMVLQGVFPCKGADRWIAISLRDAAEAARAAALLGLSEASAEALARATQHWDAVALAEALQAQGVPAGPVLDARGVLEDPQLAARDHWARLPHEEVGPTVYNASPIVMDGLPRHPSRAAPLLGQHTREVLENMLGLAPSEVDELAAAGVLR